MVRERHNVAFLVGVIFGAAGAAIAALFSTPLSGAETRQQLSARVASLRGGGDVPPPTRLGGGESAPRTIRTWSSESEAGTTGTLSADSVPGATITPSDGSTSEPTGTLGA
jgi:hypothetical protein